MDLVLVAWPQLDALGWPRWMVGRMPPMWQAANGLKGADAMTDLNLPTEIWLIGIALYFYATIRLDFMCLD